MVRALPGIAIFDLDGTLLDTFDDIVVNLKRTFDEAGRTLPERGALGRMVGDGARKLVARALGRDDDPELDAILARYLAAYARDPTPATKVLPGAVELLTALSRNGIPRVVCTNKPRIVAEACVTRLLPGLVDRLLSAGDTERLKPDREPIDRALALFGKRPEDAVMIGDGPQDILAARAAGVFSIGVLGAVFGPPDRLLAARPDLTVPSLDVLVRLLGLS